MRYKTTVELQDNGYLVIMDGVLDKSNEVNVGYDALLNISKTLHSQGRTFQKGEQFSVKKISELPPERLIITIKPEYAQHTIEILKKKYPKLEIKGKEPNLKHEQNGKAIESPSWTQAEENKWILFKQAFTKTGSSQANRDEISKKPNTMNGRKRYFIEQETSEQKAQKQLKQMDVPYSKEEEDRIREELDHLFQAN